MRRWPSPRHKIGLLQSRPDFPAWRQRGALHRAPTSGMGGAKEVNVAWCGRRSDYAASCARSVGQSVYNRAVGPIIAVAPCCEVEQGGPHLLQSSRLSAQFLGACHSQCLHVPAGSTPIQPQAEKRTDFLDGEPQITRMGDEAKTADICLRIISVAALPSRWRGDKFDLLVVADHPLRDAARL